MIARMRAFARSVTGGTKAPGRRAGGGSSREITDSEADGIVGGYEGPGDYNVDEWLHNADRGTATRIVRAWRGWTRSRG